MGSLFGSKGTKSEGTTSGGGASQGSSNSLSQGSSFSNSQGNSSSNAVSGSQSSTDPGFMTELQKVLDNQLGGTTGFTKQDAVNDVQGLLRQQATDALQSVMPSIAKSERGAGVYNTTTKDLLQNDANARITGQLANTTNQAISDYAKIEQGLIGAFAGATQAGTSQNASSSSSQTSDSNQSANAGSNQSSTSTSNQTANSWQAGENNSKGGGSGLLGLFADGGQVPMSDGTGNMEEFFQKFLDSTGVGSTAEKAAATASNPSAQGIRDTLKSGDDIGSKVENYVIDTIFSSILGFQDGGKVPRSPDQQLLEAIQKHRDGGKVRSGEKDVQEGGKIKGPQSPTGEDNQVIGVAGGEGILAKDVMEVPGVANLVEFLNSKYHKPT